MLRSIGRPFRASVPTLLTLLATIAGLPSTLGAQPLPRSSPEAQGVSSERLLEFVEEIDRRIDTMHSFMLVRHGQVVAEGWWKPQGPDDAHVLWSLSKSFTSTAVGFAVSEGRFDLDDPVLSYFPDEAPAEPSENLRAMRVRDLLSMSTGHQDEPRMTQDESWVRTFLAHPVPHRPGTFFRYNTPATYMLSAIVEKTTGESLTDYLQPRLFEPLGIDPPRWDKSPQGIALGGYGLFLKTEEIAKFGQLYRQRGLWNGKRLIDAEWIDLATARQQPNGDDPNSDWAQGYGFQFWRCRHGAYRGDGKDGQFCIVLPDQNAVIAITADCRDMQGQLNVVWEKLLPAFSDSPLPENTDAEARLRSTLESLQVDPGR
jgi:CubicO group peptidase (beta-lactamase class C family)